eukprot:jgi/Psemu1/304762/fgenesh1_kg.168_\
MDIPRTSQSDGMLDEGDLAFASCGLDRSCPNSVTTSQAQGLRLDHYQSSIRSNRNKRQRGQSCPRTTAASAMQNFSVTAAVSTRLNSSIVPDHDFEWYDLDAIREADGSSSNSDRAIIVGHHDFNAGLVFTTKRQVLGNGMEVNVVNTCIRGKRNESENKMKEEKNEQDLLFWVNGDHDKNKVEETPIEKEEREFRERMQELENEINENSTPSLSGSLSSVLDGVKKEADSDDDSDSSFFFTWRLGDHVIRL